MTDDRLQTTDYWTTEDRGQKTKNYRRDWRV